MPAERRLERLATPTIDDKRISYGCTNVPVAFFEAHLAPLFATQRANLFVLRDVKPMQQVSGSYDAAAKHGFASRPAAERTAAGNARANSGGS